MKLRLYYNPGSCSLASHIALEEIGVPYEVQLVDLKTKRHETPEYRRVNPAARVPALGVDERVLTESVAILSFLADAHPERRLLPPPGSWERAVANEWLGILSTTVHPAFRSIFRPWRVASTESGQADVAATGATVLRDALTRVDTRLGTQPYCLGETYSLCDAYLFVFYTWSIRESARAALGRTFPAIESVARRVVKRPAVRAAMLQEGLEVEHLDPSHLG